MPVELNAFFQRAAVVADNARLHVAADEGRVDTGSGLHGLRKLSVSARKAENRAAVREFMDAVSRDPRYAELAGQVRAPLEELIRAGKPLTAGHVQQARLTLDVARGMELGRALAAGGQLPPGHGASFGQYAVARNLPLDAPDQVSAALKDYLRTQVMERDSTSFTQIHGMGDSTRAARAVLLKANSPLPGQDGFFARTLERALEGGVEGFSFAALEHAFEADNADSLAALRSLPPQDRQNLSNMSDSANILSALREALPTLGEEGMRPLFLYMAHNMPALDSPAARADCARECLLHEAALPSARSVMTAHGLPENFDSALGHNPEVVRHARALLDENPGGGVVPAPARVAEALTEAVERFTAAHEPVLKEFTLMAQEPPVDIKPPLTPETLPRYLNAMLAGDAVLEPLLNDSVPLDAAFMDKLAAHAEALNSATHSFRGDFGADDVAGVLRNAVTLLLARRGVTADMHPEIMGRTMDKFGPLASNLTTLNLAVQRGYGRAAGMTYLPQGMTAFRALEGHARALLSLMPREQRAALGAALPDAPAPDDAEALRRDAELGADFLEKHFQNEGKLEEVSAEIRAFARAQGLPMPDMDPAVAARLERRAMNQLERANGLAVESLLADLANSTGLVREASTPAFRAALDEVARTHDLAGLDLDAVSVTPLFIALHTAVRETARRATTEGRPVDPADLRQAAMHSLGQSLTALKAKLDAIDALPERAPGIPRQDREDAPSFTAAEKALMKDLAQRYSLSDAPTLARLADSALNSRFMGALTGMAAPDANAKQLAETGLAMGAGYLDARQELREPAAPDDMLFMAELALRSSGMTQEDKENLVANLHSDTAQKTAGAFLMAQECPDVAADRRTACLTMPTMLNQVRMAAELAVGDDAELNPLFYSDAPGHLAEVPNGTNGCMHELRMTAGNAVSGTAEALSRHVPPLTRAQWNSLSALADDLQGRAAGSPNADLLAHWVADSADDVLAALAANRGTPLSDSQLWDAMVGGPMPRGAGGPNFGAAMLAEVDRRYQGLIRAAAPDTPEPVLQSALPTHSAMGISPKKMLELARPGGRLTLADVHGDMNMSSLRGYGPDTAYGLVTDFRRRGRGTDMMFTDRAGNGHAVHPFGISDEENTPDHPEFQAIIRTVRGMTRSEGQTARVLQAFSQAALIMPRILSTFFPGVNFSEHGNFSVHATEQEDGSVLVDIASDPSLPLVLNEQFRIETDGSHTCLRFDMARPRAGGAGAV